MMLAKYTNMEIKLRKQGKKITKKKKDLTYSKLLFVQNLQVIPPLKYHLIALLTKKNFEEGMIAALIQKSKVQRKMLKK